MKIKVRKLKKDSQKDVLIVAQVCVDTAYRGYGIAKLLYETAFVNAKANDFTEFFTEIDIGNKSSLQAHQKAGFKKVKQYTLDEQVFQIIKKAL